MTILKGLIVIVKASVWAKDFPFSSGVPSFCEEYLRSSSSVYASVEFPSFRYHEHILYTTELIEQRITLTVRQRTYAALAELRGYSVADRPCRDKTQTTKQYWLASLLIVHGYKQQ